MAKTPEGEVKDDIKTMLAVLPHTWYMMPMGSGEQTRGISDFIGCTNGKFWAIEAKRDGRHKPSLGQRLFLASVRRARGVAIVAHCDNLDVVEQRLRGLL